MPSVGHLAVGLAAARVRDAPERVARGAWILVLVVMSYLPDADVFGFPFGVPYRAPFGHRGALHSLAFAVVVAAILALGARILKLPAGKVALTGGLVLASHGLLDTLTDGGLGIALLWPLSNARYFAPWRPIPAAPLGWHLLTRHGLMLMAWELLLFLPLFVVAFWPRKESKG